MKRPTMLYKALLQQAAVDLGLSVERDIGVIQCRFEHEGLSFLTITLPVLSDSLEQGLEEGSFTCPTNFRRYGSLPGFLRGFFKLVFEDDGRLRDDPCVEAIHWIRQICRFFKKPKIACSDARERQAIRRFKSVEEDLFNESQRIDREDRILDEVSNILWSEVFSTFDPLDIVCDHGPGVTADHRLPNERRRIRQWSTRLEAVLDPVFHAFPNRRVAEDDDENGVAGGGIEKLDLRDEPGVRVVFVPKTLTSPRVIAIEPSYMQFAQQGVARLVMSILEGHSLTCDSIHFKEQEHNQRRACSASIDRRYATIDLSDASDRVHLLLVRRIFKDSGILDYLEACRSLHADLPDGTNIVLNKYASMGSALCFPVEAMVFYTLILSAIISHTGGSVTRSRIRRLSRSILVYGDDLIIPVGYTDVVTDYLESYALRVNRRKSFSRSLFRESCGGDFWNGESVKPIYAREIPPDRRSDWKPNIVMSWVSTANQFYKAGKWIVAQAIRDMVEVSLRTKIPRAVKDGPGVYFSSMMFNTGLRWNSQIQGWDQKRIVYTPLKRKDIIDGDAYPCYDLALRDRGLWLHQRKSAASEQSSPLWRCTGSGRVIIRLGRTRMGSSGDIVVRGFEAIVAYPRLLLLRGGTEDRYDRPYQRTPIPTDHDFVKATSVDFLQSTKRGAFRSKRRWITIVS